MSWISLAATGFLLITLLLDPGKRQFPSGILFLFYAKKSDESFSVLSIFFTICIMYVEFSFCLGSMIGWREIGCSDPYVTPLTPL